MANKPSDSDFNVVEKIGFALIISILVIAHFFDDRLASETKPDLIDHLNTVGQVAIYAGALYAFFNARRIIAIIFSWCVDVLIHKRVLVVRPRQESDDDTSAPQSTNGDVAAYFASGPQPAKRELKGWLPLIPVAILVGIVALAIAFRPTPDEGKQDAPVGANVQEAASEADRSCLPSYCRHEGDGASCVAEGGATIWDIASELYGRNDQTRARADEILAANADQIPPGSERRIPIGTTIAIPQPPQCEAAN